MSDTISLSQSAADALSRIGFGDFYRVEPPERMAWIALILRRLEDRPEWFPRGKLATIQSIESQVGRCADFAAAKVLVP